MAKDDLNAVLDTIIQFNTTISALNHSIITTSSAISALSSRVADVNQLKAFFDDLERKLREYVGEKNKSLLNDIVELLKQHKSGSIDEGTFDKELQKKLLDFQQTVFVQSQETKRSDKKIKSEIMMKAMAGLGAVLTPACIYLAMKMVKP